MAKKTAGKPEFVKVKLPRPTKKGEFDFQLASYNGKVYKIKKGVEVKIPYHLAEVLKNSEVAKEAAYDYINAKTTD